MATAPNGPFPGPVGWSLTVAAFEPQQCTRPAPWSLQLRVLSLSNQMRTFPAKLESSQQGWEGKGQREPPGDPSWGQPASRP